MNVVTFDTYLIRSDGWTVGNIRYRYIRMGAVEEKAMESVPDALQAAIHDLEISYAAPLAIMDGDAIVYDSRAIRADYNRRFAYSEGLRPEWKTSPPNGHQKHRVKH